MEREPRVAFQTVLFACPTHEFEEFDTKFNGSHSAQFFSRFFGWFFSFEINKLSLIFRKRLIEKRLVWSQHTLNSLKVKNIHQLLHRLSQFDQVYKAKTTKPFLYETKLSLCAEWPYSGGRNVQENKANYPGVD